MSLTVPARRDGLPRRMAARAVRRSIAPLQQLDPSRLALGRASAHGRIGFVSVYRARNAGLLEGLIAALPAGAEVRLWSLDTVPSALASRTVGVGPGMRLHLLNRLVAQIPAGCREDGLIIADDDFRCRIGSLAALVGVGNRFALDLWQPAHTADSHPSYRFVRRRTFAVLRVTRFVEQGPVVVMSARAQRALLPLPEDLGMGWGVEVSWASTARANGLRLGIVDAVAVQHLVPPGTGYATRSQQEQLNRMVRDSGAMSVLDLQIETERLGVIAGIRALR